MSRASAIAWLTLISWAWHSPVYAGTESDRAPAVIHGTVRIADHLTSQRMRFRLYPGFRSVPAPPSGEERKDEFQNIVVYLRSSELSMPATGDGPVAKIEQRGETFIPHVLPIVKGSTVSFPNEDPIFHNVFSLSGAKSFDLGRYPKGDTRSVTFEKSGIVPVFCHLHSDMSAIIVVLDNPFFAVPDQAGQYRIEGVPPGRYTLVAWHERSEPVEIQVELISGESREINLSVPIEDDEDSGP